VGNRYLLAHPQRAASRLRTPRYQCPRPCTTKRPTSRSRVKSAIDACDRSRNYKTAAAAIDRGAATILPSRKVVLSSDHWPCRRVQEFGVFDRESSFTRRLTPSPVEVYFAARLYFPVRIIRRRRRKSRGGTLASVVRRGSLSHPWASDANTGDIGVTPAHSNGTWQVDGGINIPIFAEEKFHSDLLERRFSVKQARSQLGGSPRSHRFTKFAARY